MTKFVRLLFSSYIIINSQCVFALDLGEVSSALLGGATVLSKIMIAACIVTGIGLLIVAFSQFKIHRHNPKIVPLDNPITYFILGLVILSVPYLDDIIGYDTGKRDTEKHMSQHHKTIIKDPYHGNYYDDDDDDNDD